MAENKTKPTKLSLTSFIDTLTDPTRRADAKALVKLMQSAAGEKPKLCRVHTLMINAELAKPRAGSEAVWGDRRPANGRRRENAEIRDVARAEAHNWRL